LSDLEFEVELDAKKLSMQLVMPRPWP